MNDKLLEFVKLLRKMLQFPQMTVSETETETIKEVLSQILDSNSNYGPQTKQASKAMLEAAESPMSLAVDLEAYITTHDVTR